MYLENVLSGKTSAWRLIEGLVFVGVIVFLPSGRRRHVPQAARKSPRDIFSRSLRPRTMNRPAATPGARAPSGPMSIIETFGLGKLFGHFAANADIDFTVDPGRAARGDRPERRRQDDVLQPARRNDRRRPRERSTTRAATSAAPAARKRVHLGIAKAFQTASLYPDQTVRQNCRLAALAHVQGPFALQVFRRSTRLDDVDALAERAMARLELSDVADVRAGDLSHGDKKRLDIAIALATAAADPAARRAGRRDVEGRGAQDRSADAQARDAR